MATKKATKSVETKTEITETKSARFTRLANARVSKAVKAIYNIGNLGSANYESTVEQREKIALALNAAVESAMSRLSKEQSKPTSFTL